MGIAADDASLDGDVRAEAAAVRARDWATLSTDGTTAPAVVIMGVQKTFTSRQYMWLHSNSWAGGFCYGALPAAVLGGVSQSVGVCFGAWVVFALILKFLPVSFRLRAMPTSNVSTFTAVKGVSYAIEDNSLFVLLGHNGESSSGDGLFLCTRR
jgi:hypothetical protein